MPWLPQLGNLDWLEWLMAGNATVTDELVDVRRPAWVAAVRELDLPFLDAVVGANGAEDPYCGWDSHREVHDAGAVLVRPDGFVAWRHLDAQWEDDDAQRGLEKALHRVLAITKPPTASEAGLS